VVVVVVPNLSLVLLLEAVVSAHTTIQPSIVVQQDPYRRSYFSPPNTQNRVPENGKEVTIL
jgi:hypothetical protein